MIRLVIAAVLAVAANAVGLIVAAWVLDDMSLDGAAFVLAVVIFTIAFVVIRPLIMKIGLKQAPAISGSSALIATLVALIVTDLLSDGLSISGFVTWVLATVIVWAAALLAGLLLPVIFIRNKAEQRRGNTGTTTWS